MRVLLTGGSGRLGAFVAPGLAAAGHDLVHLARRPPATGEAWVRWSLGEPVPALPVADALVHLALDHIPGRYRGGEGNDPDGFVARNLDGSLALIAAARVAGVERIVLLSTRAVYGDHRGGAILDERDTPEPETLYGRMKLALERAVPEAAALRATGVYGIPPGGGPHKWTELFSDYLAGRPILPRIGTELHGMDLAEAIRLLVELPGLRGPWNASDFMLDRSELLAAVQARTLSPFPLPPQTPGPVPGVMATARLRGLGWQPGGRARLSGFLDSIMGPVRG